MSLKPLRLWCWSAAVLLASGCALTEVKVQPWEREVLSFLGFVWLCVFVSLW